MRRMARRLPSQVCISVSTLPLQVYARRYLHLDPATLEELGTVPEMGLAETKEAIDAAARAFPAWSRTTAKVILLLRDQTLDAQNLSLSFHSTGMTYY